VATSIKRAITAGPEHAGFDIEQTPPAEATLIRLKRYQVNPRRRAQRLVPLHDARPGLITRDTPVGSIGSCFATELLKWLDAHGYNVVQTEQDGRSQTDTATVQSARFGQVVNTHCMRQIIERATDNGQWATGDHPAYWIDKNGLLHDPFRNLVTWPSREAMEADLPRHRAAVIEAIRQSRVFIVTPGIAEVWRDRRSGCVLATPPPPEIFDPAVHTFELSSVEENVENLRALHDTLSAVNPSITIVTTLSPVPLLATYRERHCVAANAVSKATLRVAVDRFIDERPGVIYFPSYEMVAGLGYEAFLDDNVHVKPDVVAWIMQSFMEHFGDLGCAGPRRKADPLFMPEARPDSPRWQPIPEPRFSMIAAYWRELWRRLGAESGSRPVAIFGGGQHTIRFLATVADVCGPRVACILDDRPPRNMIEGHPVVTPDRATPSDFAAVLISTDAHQSTLAERARAWIGDSDTCIVAMYEGIAPGPYPTHDGIRWTRTLTEVSDITPSDRSR
jgi:hypothetical protein